MCLKGDAHWLPLPEGETFIGQIVREADQLSHLVGTHQSDGYRPLICHLLAVAEYVRTRATGAQHKAVKGRTWMVTTAEAPDR